MQVTKIDTDYTGDFEKDLEKALDTRFGRVHEISVLRDTGNILNHQMSLIKVMEKIGDTKSKNELCLDKIEEQQY